MAYQSTHTGAQVDEAVDKALSADAVPTPSSTNLVQSGGVFGVVSNRNLLDNPFFTVNQRGAPNGTTITHLKYGVDRWFGAGASYKPDANGVIVDGTIVQKWEDTAWLVGKTVTFSTMYADGTVAFGTGTFGSGTINFSDGGQIAFPSATQGNVAVGDKTKVVRAMKLEIGSVSTIANDTPPNYAEELAKCQYYFYRLKDGEPLYGSRSIGAANYSSFRVPVIMRATPTATKNGGTITIYGQNGAPYGFSSFNNGTIDYNAIGVYLSQNGSYAGEKLVMFNSGGTIDLSADL